VDDAAPASQARWSTAECVAFRVACAYFALYNFPFPLGLIPGTESIGAFFDGLWNGSVPWVGKHVLHLANDITILPNGSGDTTFNYVQMFCHVVLALLAAAIWSIADRRRHDYTRMLGWLRIYLRYVLAVAMWGYGMNKVIKLQFPFPSTDRLMEPYGDSSPMGLLWTFMGFSTSFTFFAGACEVLGGALLFFRRTTTLGALVVCAVMLNIVLMNFSYDVPVKLYSSNLLLMSTFLVLGDARRLIDVFLLNRATVPASLGSRPTHRWARRAFVAAKLLFVGYVVVSNITSSLKARTQYGELAPRPPLYGVFNVELFVRDGEVQPPLVTDSTQWRRISFNAYGGATIRFMDDSTQRFMVELDAEHGTLVLTARDESGAKWTFHYSRPDETSLSLDGTFAKAELNVALSKFDESNFTLVGRGFHWINEYPFNK
jgi:uncharacterized membrane protein YphA (DoxX/SURF4 family)